MTKASLRSAAGTMAVTAAGVCLLAAPAVAAAPGHSTVISLSTKGAPSAGAIAGAVSADGRYATFTSGASDIVAGDSNGVNDVFRRDLVRGVTVRVSVPTPGRTSTDRTGSGSRASALSADGRYVAFSSRSTNLTTATASGGKHVYVRDMQLGKTVLVDVTRSGAPSAGGADEPSISADGSQVAFTSYASDLVAGDTNARTDVFVRDLVACGPVSSRPSPSADPVVGGCCHTTGSSRRPLVGVRRTWLQQNAGKTFARMDHDGSTETASY